MNQKDNITGTNILEDNISTMINNGDVDYDTSPCVVMNNLVKNHNQLVDEMGDKTTSSSSIINKNSQGYFTNSTGNLNPVLNQDLENQVKEFDPPVDYETAFGEYYPDEEKPTEKPSNKNKS